MKLPRIYISAAHKSSGKTTLSLGICRALSRMGNTVQPFKKGPDYIDPLWLGAASHRHCYNFDFNTMTEQEITMLLASRGRGADIAIIEGNKGLYDGLELDGSTSNAAMAKLTKTPVILVIDAQGTTRGVAPLLLGYQAFDKAVDIAGVIFNKVGGERHENKLTEITQYYTDIPILGCVQRSNSMLLTERHLGLMPYNEISQANRLIDGIASQVADQVDLGKLLEYAKKAQTITEPQNSITAQGTKLKIAVFRDTSFGFYYEDDLEAFENAGAELLFVNAIDDECLPDVDGVFIGGGFPETKIEALAANTRMRQSLFDAIESGLPVYAECGGLMYLSESITWQGITKPMVGIIPAPITLSERPQGRGYVSLAPRETMPWLLQEPTKIIAGHEFHYSQLNDPEQKLLKKGAFAYDVVRGYGIDGQHDGWVYKNLLASYAHMRDTQQFHWVANFLQFIKDRDKA
ncbi:MAG: hydrogenobyrinic acid a,c-diamide synthase (glutamine-hydrolyzing) [Thiotrichaceae bacterium]|nr:hydrogenobyrinic acid a,c-diamide synthase (glutamine-hydrolyzing) [Thiotrichaceae bacterium]